MCRARSAAVKLSIALHLASNAGRVALDCLRGKMKLLSY